uniref:Uncharacterized protein n=1 Tax=Bionectria ochroleuca TaxID=29856 RepID=A0A8H7NMJ6_BIOOC
MWDSDVHSFFFASLPEFGGSYGAIFGSHCFHLLNGTVPVRMNHTSSNFRNARNVACTRLWTLLANYYLRYSFMVGRCMDWDAFAGKHRKHFYRLVMSWLMITEI